MPLEPSVTYISDFNPAWPTGGDDVSAGDNNFRNIKGALQQSFPNIKGPMMVAHDQVASKQDIANAQFSTSLPGQSGNAGKFLQTDGSNATWQQVLPTQASNAGKFLTTDGTATSWTSTLKASLFRLVDGTDATKIAAFDLSSIPTGTTRTYTLPSVSGTLALRTDTAMQLLASATVSSAVATIDFLNIFTSAYDRYVVDVALTTTSADFFSIRVATGGLPDGSSGAYTPMQPDAGTMVASQNSFIPVAANTSITIGSIEFRNVNSGAIVKNVGARGVAYSPANNNYSTFAREGVYGSNSVLTGFRLFTAGGATFNGGTVRVYGIKNS